MNTANKPVNKNKAEISLLNILFCFLVIFIHVSSEPVSSLNRESWQYFAVFIPWRLSAFVVQGFIFLSGLKLFLNTDTTAKISYPKYYLSRLQKIALPYLAVVCVYYVYFLTCGYFSFDIKEFLSFILIGNLASHFYFVIIIMQFYLLRPLWQKLCNASPFILLPFSLLLMLILGQNLPGIIALFSPDYYFAYADRIFTTYLFYFIGGCYAGLYYGKFVAILKENKTLILIIWLFAAGGNAVFSILHFTQKATLYWLETFHILYCIFTILFLYTAALALSEKKWTSCKMIKSVNALSYEIYLIHPLMIIITNGFLHRFSISSLSARYFIRIAVVYGIVAVIGAIRMHWGKTLS